VTRVPGGGEQGAGGATGVAAIGAQGALSPPAFWEETA
jgi:hypothetical protein